MYVTTYIQSCVRYVCFFTAMCYIAIHTYDTICIQSIVTLHYIYVCYYYVTVICYNAIHMYVTIYELDMYVNI